MIPPRQPLIKAELVSVPNSLANSTASSITTLGGVLLTNLISQIAQRRMAKSTLLIFSSGHLGAIWEIKTLISGRWLIISKESGVDGSGLPTS